jgi:mRNA interferase MazF
VAGAAYLEIIDTLALVVPITTTNRGWPNHIEMIGTQLNQRSWAMSEQIRTISRDRVVDRSGHVDDATLAAVRGWIADFLEL